MRAWRILRTATARQPAPALPVADDAAARSRISTLLQNTASLLPRALSAADGAVGPDSSPFWNKILETSIAELSSGHVPAKASVAVCGFDRSARSYALVTALLQDPFASDPAYSDILRSRWKDAPGCVNIEHGRPAAFAGELSSPSDWLQRFPYPVRLTELPDRSSPPSITDDADTLLLNSDVLLVLCDPVVTSLSDLAVRVRHLLNKPNTILVLASGSTSDLHRQLVSQTLSKVGSRPGHILFVDPEQALDAVKVLQANPKSPSAIDRYQRDTLGSRISTITAAINEILSTTSQSETPLLDLRHETILSQVHGSLSASFRSVEDTMKHLDRVSSKVEDLSSGIQRIRENTLHDILGKPGEDNKVEKALSVSSKEINTLLGSLTFSRMIWRVDEIGALVSAAVHDKWCKGLERQLILQTGRLDCAQREMSTAAFSLTSTPCLYSPVLQNQLRQLICSPTYALTPDSLTQPLHDRRSQLIRHTAVRLHREAQSATGGACGGLLGGAGLGWWLAFGEHILSLGAGTEMGTAIGSGAFIAVIAIRWAVGKWERAKRRWTQDLIRIGEGLTRDLKKTIQRTVDDNVTIVASTACNGVQGLVDSRRSEMQQLNKELCDLNAELHGCAQFSASWTGQGGGADTDVDIE